MVAWSMDRQHLASAGQDGKIRLWDPTTGTQTREMPGGASWVERVAWGPTGNLLASAAGKKLRLLWLSCGDSDRLMDGSKSFHEALAKKQVPHVWHIDSGGHTWAVWKNDLYLLAQKLFQDK